MRCVCFISWLGNLAIRFTADLGHEVVVEKSNRDHRHELKISYLLQVPTNNLPRHPLSEKTFLKTWSFGPNRLWRRLLEMALVDPKSYRVWALHRCCFFNPCLLGSRAHTPFLHWAHVYSMVSKHEYVPCEYDTLCLSVSATGHCTCLCARGRRSTLISCDWIAWAEEGGKSRILILGFNSTIMPADIMTI